MNEYLANIRRQVDLDDDYGFKYIELILNSLNRFKYKNKYTFRVIKLKKYKEKLFLKNLIPYKYCEAHHIIPRTCKGDDSCNNIVLLYMTKEQPEHILAHKYLSRSTSLFCKEHDSLKLAYLFMTTKHGIILDDSEAAELRELSRLNKRPVSENTRLILRQKRIGSHLSLETRKKISKRTSGKNNPMYGKRGKNNPNYDRKNTPEAILKMKNAWTEDRRIKQKDNFNHKNKTIIEYNGNIYDVYQLSLILNITYSTVLRNLDKYNVIRKYSRKTKNCATKILNDSDGKTYSVKQLELIEILGYKRSYSTILKWARNNKNGLHIVK